MFAVAPEVILSKILLFDRTDTLEGGNEADEENSALREVKRNNIQEHSKDDRKRLAPSDFQDLSPQIKCRTCLSMNNISSSESNATHAIREPDQQVLF